jgi:tetratricopeptide (TPR) repeat protein
MKVCFDNTFSKTAYYRYEAQNAANSGHPEQAIDYLNMALNIDHYDARIFYGLSAAYFNKQDYPNAKANMEKARALDINSSNGEFTELNQALIDAFDALYHSKPHDAIKALTASLQLNEDKETRYHLLLIRAQAFATENDCEQTIYDEEEAITIHENSFPAYILLASCYSKLWSLDKQDSDRLFALKYANRAISINPTSPLGYIQWQTY